MQDQLVQHTLPLAQSVPGLQTYEDIAREESSAPTVTNRSATQISRDRVSGGSVETSGSSAPAEAPAPAPPVLPTDLPMPMQVAAGPTTRLMQKAENLTQEHLTFLTTLIKHINILPEDFLGTPHFL